MRAASLTRGLTSSWLREAQGVSQPRTGKRPLTLHRSFRQLHHLCGLLYAEACEQPEPHHVGGLSVLLLQATERVIKGHDFGKIVLAGEVYTTQLDPDAMAASLVARSGSRVFHENATHSLGGRVK